MNTRDFRHPNSRFGSSLFQAIARGGFGLPGVALAWTLHAAGPDLTELPLETLMQIEVPTVYGASKFEQEVSAAPSAITVLTAEDIKRYGYRTLGDALQSVQGFHVSYDRNYVFLGARGVNLGDFNGRILLLVDGHRINNNLTDAAYVDTAFLLDVDLIDRIEIIRGPGSVLYGNNAFFGVINVVTRKGGQVESAEVSGEYASFDTYKGRATYGRVLTNGVQLLFSGTYYASAGPDRLYYPEFDTPAQNGGIAEKLDPDDLRSAFGSVSYRGFTLQGAFIRREKGNPTAQFSTVFNDGRLRTVDERGYVSLKYDRRIGEDADLSAQVYYDRNVFDIGYPTRSPAGTTLFEEHDAGEWWGAEVQLNRRLWERHMITVGAEYRDDFLQYQRGSDADTGVTLREERSNRSSHGVYVQGDFAVATNLHVNGGVRYDRYGDFNPAFSPRVGLIYNPLEGTTLKALYGTAFRVPSFLELILSDDLEPEEISAYELVYEQEIGRYLRSTVSGFYNRMEDLILFTSGSFQNVDAESRGIEAALEGAWTWGMRTRLSYTIQEVENRSGSLDLPDAPQQLVKLHLSVPVIRDKLFAGIELHYMSARPTFHNTTDGFGQPLTVQGVEADDFTVVNFTLLSRELIKNLEASVSIYNVLDRRYGDPATRFHRQDVIEQDGRSFRVKLVYRF